LRAAAGAWPTVRAIGIIEEIDRALADLGGNLNKGLLAMTFFTRFQELAHA
jgi:hypothetical protein